MHIKMRVIVKKFGGTSVGDIARIKKVARLLKDYRDSNSPVSLVVVVSAMAGETNRLVRLSQLCSDRPDPRELDVLLASGEQASIALLSMALIDLGVSARSLLGFQANIRTDSRHTQAAIEDIDLVNLQKTLSSGEIAIVAGFQGADASGEITTLGRGGSDVTAVALAAALKAEACFIYTDVPGVYSANPVVCGGAKLSGQLCHEEMLEMASLGAKVLHPRSVYFAMRYKVPLVVLSTFEKGAGTWIVKEEDLVEKAAVSGVICQTDEAKLTIHGISGGIGAASVFFTALAQGEIAVDMIGQATLPDGRVSISCTIADQDSSKALQIAQDLVEPLAAQGASLDRNIAKVSIVGIGMRYQSGVAAVMFEALASEKIDVEMISTSEIKISVLVPRKYCEVAVRVLHRRFIEEGLQIAEKMSCTSG